MSRSTVSDRTFVGVDVAKRTLDVALSSQHKSRSFGADPKGLAQLVQYVQQVSGPHVCLEATGGYERSLVEALDQAGVPYSVINPLNVRCFIKSIGKLDKTDQLDSRALALFGERMQPEPTTPVSLQQARLKDLQARREQVVEHAGEAPPGYHAPTRCPAADPNRPSRRRQRAGQAQQALEKSDRGG